MQRLPLFRRALESIGLVWLVVTLTFLLIHAAPGNPEELLVAPAATAEESARLRAELGLDASVATQYARWLGGVVSGDLGQSFATREPVTSVIRRALPFSVALGALSMLLTFALGVAFGLWQAARAGTKRERLLGSLALAVFAAPSYWLSLALIAVFTFGATRLGFPDWARLPAFGVESPGAPWRGFTMAHVVDIARHAVLPTVVLALIGAAGIARYARASALGLLREDWTRTARGKGASERRVLGRHVLANARVPLIILFALTLPGTIAGSVFVESVFAWPGMGRTMLSAISGRDTPVVVGITLVYAVAVIAANWLADVAALASDPRLRRS